jgi:hypothetical protein
MVPMRAMMLPENLFPDGCHKSLFRLWPNFEYVFLVFPDSFHPEIPDGNYLVSDLENGQYVEKTQAKIAHQNEGQENMYPVLTMIH